MERPATKPLISKPQKLTTAAMQKQMTKADIAKQELASEIQNMDDLYESQKTEVHIYGI